MVEELAVATAVAVVRRAWGRTGAGGEERKGKEKEKRKYYFNAGKNRLFQKRSEKLSKIENIILRYLVKSDLRNSIWFSN